MKRRNRQNIPIYMVLAAVVMIVLVIALGSLGGDGETPVGDIFPSSPEPSIESTPTALPTVEIPPSMLATPVSPGKVIPVVEDEDTDFKYVDGDVIVKFSPGITVDLATGLTNSDEINAFLSAQKIDAVDWLALLPDGSSLEHVPEINQIYKYTFPQGTDVLGLSENLSVLSDIEFATVNSVGEIDGIGHGTTQIESRSAQPQPSPSPTLLPPPNDPCYFGGSNCNFCPRGQWAMNDTGNARLGVPDAWQITTGSDQVIVTVIDTGYDILHPELRRKYAGHAYDFINDIVNVLDEDGHGTAVSGIIAAETNTNPPEGIAGMSWGARIMPLKVFDSAGNSSGYAIQQAILWAANNNADVINMSLMETFTGSPFGRILWQIAVDYAYSEGVIVVVSAGNDSEELNPNDDTTFAPAEMEHVIVVGATNDNDEPCRPTIGFIRIPQNTW